MSGRELLSVEGASPDRTTMGTGGVHAFTSEIGRIRGTFGM